MDLELRDDGAVTDGLWERMRSEERADQLSQVVQDTVRDAKIAELLESGASAYRRN